nr:hypothetical protein [Rhizobium leguminosarum]
MVCGLQEADRRQAELPVDRFGGIAQIKTATVDFGASGAQSRKTRRPAASVSSLVVGGTQNMQHASRISDNTAFTYLGELIEYGPTAEIFQSPKVKRTEDYITSRYG